jgi:hypothetical protein
MSIFVSPNSSPEPAPLHEESLRSTDGIAGPCPGVRRNALYSSCRPHREAHRSTDQFRRTNDVIRHGTRALSWKPMDTDAMQHSRDGLSQVRHSACWGGGEPGGSCWRLAPWTPSLPLLDARGFACTAALAARLSHLAFRPRRPPCLCVMSHWPLHP